MLLHDVFLQRQLTKRKWFSSVSSVSTLVGEAQIQEYNNNGAICIRGAFDEKWLKLIEKGLEKNLRTPSKYNDWLTDDNGKGLFFNDYYNYTNIPEYLEYVMCSPAAEIAGHLMQSKKSIFFYEHMFYKEAASTKETPWHHDQAYYPIDGNQNCSVWMPTTKIQKESSLKFIQGSHKLKKYFIPRLFASNQNYEMKSPNSSPQGVPSNSEKEAVTDTAYRECDIEEIIQNIQDYKILQWELEPGDCIVFNMKTIHGTEKSFNPDKRIVMATRWLGDDATYTRRRWPTSPFETLLPKSLKVGCRLAESKEFLVPWKRE